MHRCTTRLQVRRTRFCVTTLFRNEDNWRRPPPLSCLGLAPPESGGGAVTHA